MLHYSPPARHLRTSAAWIRGAVGSRNKYRLRRKWRAWGRRQRSRASQSFAGWYAAHRHACWRSLLTTWRNTTPEKNGGESERSRDSRFIWTRFTLSVSATKEAPHSCTHQMWLTDRCATCGIYWLLRFAMVQPLYDSPWTNELWKLTVSQLHIFSFWFSYWFWCWCRFRFVVWANPDWNCELSALLLLIVLYGTWLLYTL